MKYRMRAAIVASKYKDKLILVRKVGSNTWELPGGRKEEDESVFCCAIRELQEETGALEFTMTPVKECYDEKNRVFDMLFCAEVIQLSSLDYSHLEIAEIGLFDELPAFLTYPHRTKYFLEGIGG